MQGLYALTLLISSKIKSYKVGIVHNVPYSFVAHTGLWLKLAKPLLKLLHYSLKQPTLALCSTK
jgi:hypothetical protein